MAQWNKCFYCGCDLIFTKKVHPRQRTVDHFIPESAGGDKFVDACRRCNGLKGQSSVQEFKDWLGIDRFFGEARGWKPW